MIKKLTTSILAILIMSSIPLSAMAASQTESPSLWQKTTRKIQTIANRENLVIACMIVALAARSFLGAKEITAENKRLKEERARKREEDALAGKVPSTPCCPLCLDNLDDETKPEVQTSCPDKEKKIHHHRFHRACFDKSECVNEFYVCPLCRHSLLPKKDRPAPKESEKKSE